jgi:hypothetical protein
MSLVKRREKQPQSDGIAQGISAAYYPSQDRTAGAIATEYGYEVMRDALTNFREFWPGIATHVLHRHP